VRRERDWWCISTSEEGERVVGYQHQWGGRERGGVSAQVGKERDSNRNLVGKTEGKKQSVRPRYK
jgi:hypothetical protein